MNNKLMTLDGLIERLKELREIAGCDCPIVLGKSFDSRKERLKLTMVSLDSMANGSNKHVAMLVENFPWHPLFYCNVPKNEAFELAFSVFEKENPDWRSTLSDSTYNELAEWYDVFQGENKEELTDTAWAFANYVWNKIK
jgi:hypothetical protein